MPRCCHGDEESTSDCWGRESRCTAPTCRNCPRWAESWSRLVPKASPNTLNTVSFRSKRSFVVVFVKKLLANLPLIEFIWENSETINCCYWFQLLKCPQSVKRRFVVSYGSSTRWWGSRASPRKPLPVWTGGSSGASCTTTSAWPTTWSWMEVRTLQGPFESLTKNSEGPTCNRRSNSFCVACRRHKNVTRFSSEEEKNPL